LFETEGTNMPAIMRQLLANISHPPQRQSPMFFPYRSDLGFNRIPIISILVCVLCIVVFYQQSRSEDRLIESAQRYCDRDHPRLFWRTMDKIAGDHAAEACPHILNAILSSARPQQTIDKISAHSTQWDMMTADDSRRYTHEQLQQAFAEFRPTARPSLTSRLEFDPATFNVWHMLTAAIAHADLGHIIGNLLFFYAFATTVEIIIGSILFTLTLVTLAIGTHTVYAISQSLAHSTIPTIGLSGVVMGVIGLFVYLVPHARIRCLLWILIFWKVLRVPAWMLAAWYVGWDVYSLLHDDGSSHVNFVAHVSGAALGYLLGMMFFRHQKELAQDELDRFTL
jgi:membrane associated rhomboid family serine protease